MRLVSPVSVTPMTSPYIEPPSTPVAHPIVVGLRWLLVLPASAVGAYLAWLAVNFLNRLTFLFQGINPNSLLSRLFIEAASSAAMGAAAVYAGAKTAPANRRPVVFVLAALTILAGGFLLFPAMIARDGWAIYSVAWLLLGAGSVAWSVYTGETGDFDD